MWLSDCSAVLFRLHVKVVEGRYNKEGNSRQTDEFMTPIVVKGNGRVEGRLVVRS